jgi:hypothetical protein
VGDVGTGAVDDGPVVVVVVVVVVTGFAGAVPTAAAMDVTI